MSTAANTGRRDSRRGAWGVRIALCLAGLLVLGVVVLGSSLIFGIITGEEFSPDTFDRRSFSYCEIPLVHIQVTPISRTSTTSQLESHLVANKLVPRSASKPRWDLVSMTNVAPQSDKCDARILVKYFECKNDTGTPLWLAWTQKNPELAKVFWPTVSEVAQQQLYIFVPELIDCARIASEPKKFQTDLAQVLGRKYREFARCQQQLERHDDAVELFTQALVHEPQSTEALLGRATSLEALGKIDKAQADLAEANKLVREPS